MTGIDAKAQGVNIAMTTQATTENLRIKLEALLAADISDFGFEAKIRHQRRIESVRSAIETPAPESFDESADLAHTD